MPDYSQPGPDLSALVAEKIMGWKQLGHDLARNEYIYEYFLDHVRVVESPKFSTDISAAMQIVQKMCNTWVMFWHDVYAEWEVRCDPQRRIYEDCRYEAWSETLPGAICVAALKAVGVLTEGELECSGAGAFRVGRGRIGCFGSWLRRIWLPC